MKIIVRSTSPKHGLLNIDGKFLPPNRPCVAFLTPLVEQRIAKGDFKLIVGNLDDAATDEEFVKYLEEAQGTEPEKRELFAIDAFESTYSNEAVRRKLQVEETEAERQLRLDNEKKAREAEQNDDPAAQAAALLAAAGTANAENLNRDASAPGESTTTQSLDTAVVKPAKGVQNTPTPASNKR